MFKQSDTILVNTLDLARPAIAYVGVRVQAFVGDVEQQLYSDDAGTPAALVQTDANGYYQFWIEEGDYELRFSVGGVLLGDGDYELWNPARSADLPFLSAKQLGVIPGGVINTTTLLMAAINSAAALGVPLDGGGLTYAVSGDMLFTGVAGINIRNFAIKQLSPNAVNRRTLYFNNCPGLKIDGLKIDLNGTGTEGGLTTSAGLWIEGGEGHSVSNVEAFGNSKGSGIYIGNTSHGEYTGLYAHDIAYSDAAATDDQVHGIWFNGNSNCVAVGLRAHDLTGNATGRDVDCAWTRGTVFSGNQHCAFTGFAVSNVDQGIDVTGGAGNLDCTFTSGTIEQVGLFGVKLANSAVRCTVADMIVDGSGLTGFVANGPAEAGLTNITMDSQFVNCISRRPGSVGTFAGTKAGFRIMQAANDTDYPKGVRFIDCGAYDDLSNMQFGFHCETPYDGASKKLNEVINSTSIGHSTAATFGFAYWGACATGTADQTIPNATWTAIDFEGPDVFDGAAMHDIASNNSNINTPVGGLYQVSFKMQFATNATGYRKVRMLSTGTPIAGAEFSASAVTGDVTTVTGSLIVPFVVGANVRLEVYQTSGGNLSVIRSQSLFSAFLLKMI